MDSLFKDVLIYLLQKLDANSVLAMRRVAKRYALYGKSDLLWQRLTIDEFGAVEQTDVVPTAADWFTVYQTFNHALKYALADAAENQCTKMYINRKTQTESGYAKFDALLFRRLDKSMMIPDKYAGIYGKAGIKPRRGDTIIDLGRIGYRNDGISFWNGTNRIKPNDEVDDYGSTPFEFTYPEFPPGYFHAGHGDYTNVLVSQEMVEMISNERMISPLNHVLLAWIYDKIPTVGTVMVYDHNIDEIYFGDNIQNATSNLWETEGSDDEPESE